MSAKLQGLGPWRLLATLGEGERATVYRATREGEGSTATPVALKVLHRAVVHDEDATKAFAARADLAQDLDHAAIVPVLEAGDVDGRPYEVRELLEAVPLTELLPRSGRGRIAPPQSAVVLRSVLEALAAARRGKRLVVHGALDTGDVLVDADGVVRVAGFGTEGPPQSDLLAVARLAQALCQKWPPEVDAWLDRLQGDDTPFADPAAALEAFPIAAADADAAGLARRAKRAIRKRERQEGEAAAPATSIASKASPAPRSSKKTPRKERRRGDRRQGDRRSGRQRRGRPPRVPAEPDILAREARWVAAICALVFLAAVILAITGG